MIQGFSGGLLNRQLIYQTDLPSFQRDFASLKSLNHGTGPNITFTRASDATFFDADGVLQTAGTNVPRFDHDPATGASRGILIEEARTNLFERSAEFDNAYWTKQDATITANSVASPNGQTVADTLVENSGAVTNPRVYRDVTISTAGAFTLSCFVKAAGRDRCRLMFSGGAGTAWTSTRIANFLLTGSGSISSTSGTGVTATIASVGSDWYRCTISATSDSNGTARNSIYVLDGTASESYTGDGTSGLYIWGAQLEAGAFATSYIPTTTATATRAADSAVVTPISSFYNQAEGTLFAEGSAAGTTAFGALFSVDDTTADERIQIRRDPNTAQRYLNVVVTDNNVSQATLNTAPATWATDTEVKRVALAVKADDLAVSMNGATALTDTSATLPTVTRMLIGDGVNSARANGHIRKVAYWPKRLTNTLLEQITT